MVFTAHTKSRLDCSKIPLSCKQLPYYKKGVTRAIIYPSLVVSKSSTIPTSFHTQTHSSFSSTPLLNIQCHTYFKQVVESSKCYLPNHDKRTAIAAVSFKSVLPLPFSVSPRAIQVSTTIHIQSTCMLGCG